jgi:hypothetical protein
MKKCKCIERDLEWWEKVVKEVGTQGKKAAI